MRARPDEAAKVDWRLYFVTDTALCGGPDRVAHVVEQAVLGGAGVVQIRDKTMTDDEFARLTRDCILATDRAFDATGRRAAVFVNDRLSIADRFGLHLHLGQSDGDLEHARYVMGEDTLIGLSISNDDQLAAELADPTADVLGISPVWATPTKKDTDPALGLDGARRIVHTTAGRAVTVGIGGINLDNAADVIATGVDGICVVSAIAAAQDPRAAAARLLSQWRTS